MRVLAWITLAFSVTLLLFAFVGSPAQAGASCPTRTSCATESRAVAVTHLVQVRLCISKANWRALNAHWKAQGYNGQCFWWASSRRKHATAWVYARCGTVVVYAKEAYAYNGRINWDYFGPWR